jgi:hypothetical protein
MMEYPSFIRICRTSHTLAYTAFPGLLFGKEVWFILTCSVGDNLEDLCKESQ